MNDLELAKRHIRDAQGRLKFVDAMIDRGYVPPAELAIITAKAERDVAQAAVLLRNAVAPC